MMHIEVTVNGVWLVSLGLSAAHYLQPEILIEERGLSKALSKCIRLDQRHASAQSSVKLPVLRTSYCRAVGGSYHKL
jgi:hypothetical protein